MTQRTESDLIPFAAAAVAATLATAAIAAVALGAAVFLVSSAPAEAASTPAAVVALSIVQERS
jgi:hypothetical protein